MAETYDFLTDLGGTNVRFALVPAGQHTPESAAKFANKDFESFEEAAHVYLNDVGNPKLSKACIAVAAPVRGDEIQLTNYVWHLSAEALRQQLALQQLFFCQTTILLLQSRYLILSHRKESRLVILGI